MGVRLDAEATAALERATIAARRAHHREVTREHVLHELIGIDALWSALLPVRLCRQELAALVAARLAHLPSDAVYRDGASAIPHATPLAKLKRLRGGPFDVFGRAVERRQTRQLIEEYIARLVEITSVLSTANHGIAVQLASVPDEIRGYGHIRERSLRDARELEARLTRELREGAPQRIAA